MRCYACNAELTDYEATRKDKQKQFIDLCNGCFKASNYDQEYTDRADLLSEADITYPDEDISYYNDNIEY